jgi:hypothetical protein
MALTLDPRIDRGETWLLRRLNQVTRQDIWKRVNDGVTDQAVRRDRLAAFILEHGLEIAIAGKNQKGAVETFGDVFARIYGRPLVTDETAFGGRDVTR